MYIVTTTLSIGLKSPPFISLGKINSFTPHFKNNSVAWLYSRKWAMIHTAYKFCLSHAATYILASCHAFLQGFFMLIDLYHYIYIYFYIYKYTQMMGFGRGSDGLSWFTFPPFIEKQTKAKCVDVY